MAKEQLNARISDLTRNQLDALCKLWGASQTETLTVIIDRIYQLEEHKMNTSKYDYTVIEDNGGGLHLFLFRPGTEKIVMGFTGFEYSPGNLVPALDLLDDGDNARSWDGKMDDAQAQWDYIHSHEFGYQVIAYSENGERTIKPEKMGRAGQIEFGIETE